MNVLPPLSAGSPEDFNAKELDRARFTKDFNIIPIPRRLRYHAGKTFHFGMLLNILFGFASTLIVANLYYSQPLLIQFSRSFNVSYDEVSMIPTLAQVGYAVGLILLSPLGDLVRPRQLVLGLSTLSTLLTIGLAFAYNLTIFQVITFLVGVFSVTPPVLLPLAADLAPPERRASAISVVASGILLGILAARVLAGVIAEFASWRVVYYMAIGIQAVVLIGSYLMIPDYPPKNEGLLYWDILWTTAKFGFTEPLLVQTSLINIALSACFTNFWVTLTFLLGGPPYNYSTLVIGLFGLTGIFGAALLPFCGRLIDRVNPWHVSLGGLVGLLCTQSIQTAAGGISAAVVVITALSLNLIRQIVQVSLSTAALSISAAARSRLNAVFVLSNFIGQAIGTSVGTYVFVKYGWRAAAGLNMGLYGFQLVILLLRGPHCSRFTWFGHEGGFGACKSAVEEQEKKLEADTRRCSITTTGLCGRENRCPATTGLRGEEMNKGGQIMVVPM